MCYYLPHVLHNIDRKYIQSESVSETGVQKVTEFRLHRLLLLRNSFIFVRGRELVVRNYITELSLQQLLNPGSLSLTQLNFPSRLHMDFF